MSNKPWLDAQTRVVENVWHYNTENGARGTMCGEEALSAEDARLCIARQHGCNPKGVLVWRVTGDE